MEKNKLDRLDNVTLKVYADDMVTVVKELSATTTKIPFSLIRSLMKIFEIDKLEDQSEMMKIVLDSWNEITRLLNRVFPEMSEDDWDHVDVEEVGIVLVDLLRDVLFRLMGIPKGKNV